MRHGSCVGSAASGNLPITHYPLPITDFRMSSRQDTGVSSTADIVADLKAGRMVVLVDEAERENEGDLLIAAEFVTPDAINFMARYGRGLICLTLTEQKCRRLNLQRMVA